MYRNKILYLLVIYLIFSCCSVLAVNDLSVYKAVQSQVNSLKEQGKFKEAVRALDSFSENFPYSKVIDKILFEKSCILIDNLKLIEDGFLCLEKAQVSQNQNLRKKIFIKKNIYAKQITNLRLLKLIFFLESFFTEKLTFPVNLAVLVKKYKGLNFSSVIDGYGRAFEYKLIDNEALKDKDLLEYIIFSKGQDGISNTLDDIKTGVGYERDKNIQIIAIYFDNNEWKAEISLPDKKNKRINKMTIDERSVIEDIEVFSIRKSGVILLIDNKPVVIRK